MNSETLRLNTFSESIKNKDTNNNMSTNFEPWAQDLN